MASGYPLSQSVSTWKPPTLRKVETTANLTKSTSAFVPTKNAPPSIFRTQSDTTLLNSHRAQQQEESSKTSLKGTGNVPIWEKERQAEEERRRQSMAVRTQNAELLDKVASTVKTQNLHPGLFKTCFRENMDPSGTVLLSPDGMMWTCCRQTTEDAPGCRSGEISPYHQKCSKCGDFFLDIENKAKSCDFHSGCMCKPPSDSETDIVCFQCCMKVVGSRGCTQSRHIPIVNYKPNPKHDSGPPAPPISKSGPGTPRSGVSRNNKQTNSPTTEKSSFVNTNPAKKFDPSKVKTKADTLQPNAANDNVKMSADSNAIPIWEKERMETEARKQKSMIMRNMKSQLKEQAEKTSVVQMVHPGIFKTTFRENMDSSGVVLLSPDGRIFTCCRATSEQAPGCQSMLISSLHDKCSKCGNFFLEFDNKDKACCYHPGNLCKPPDPDAEIVCYQCCMKPVGSKGCSFTKHIPLSSYKPNIPEDATSANKIANAMAEAAKKTQLELIETSLRTCLQGIKNVYNLVEQKAKVPDVVQACKTLVANVTSLVSQTKPLDFEKLSKAGEEFKASVSAIIKAVQTACKQNYQDEKSIQEMKTACNSAVANAKNVVATAKEVPSKGISISLNAPPPPPGPPPPPPPMTGGVPPPPPPMKGTSGSKPTAKKGNKGEVLQAIGGFNRTMLKKAVTVDKSKPVRTAEIEEGDVDIPPQ